MNKAYALIIALAVALAIAVGYILYNTWFTSLISNCRQEGINQTLQGLVDQIKLRGTAISIKIGQDNLICSTEGVLNGLNKT